MESHLIIPFFMWHLFFFLIKGANCQGDRKQLEIAMDLPMFKRKIISFPSCSWLEMDWARTLMFFHNYLELISVYFCLSLCSWSFILILLSFLPRFQVLHCLSSLFCSIFFFHLSSSLLSASPPFLFILLTDKSPFCFFPSSVFHLGHSSTGK